jgi:hypothetical protein
VLEFDFVNLIERPVADEVLTQEKFDLLLDWLRHRHEKDKLEVQTLCTAFTVMCEMLTLRSEQLGMVVDLIDGK